MRYSYEFKKMAVEMYFRGEWPETPADLTQKGFRAMIRKWSRLEIYCGPEANKHKHTNRRWTAEDRYTLVADVLAGASILEVALREGINSGQLYAWVRKYKVMGYNGLVDKKKGRKSNNPSMKQKKAEPRPLTESEREELIRLRAENEYIKAENEVIKKEIALREEKEAARLKARKQQSSKNSEKKDSN